MKFRKEAGKYVADVYDIDTATGHKRRIRKRFDTTKEAAHFKTAVLSKQSVIRFRGGVGLQTRTIADLVNYYYSLARFKTLEDGTKKRNRELIKHFTDWCEANSIKYVHQVTRDAANQYMSHIMDISKNKGQLHNFTVAKMLFNEELERDNPCIQRNPFPKKSPFVVIKRNPIAIRSDVRQLLFDEMSPLEEAVFGILFHTGMRSGELSNLTWDQVTATGVRIESHEVFQSATGKWVEWKPKTKANRVLPFNAESRRHFESLRRMQSDHNYVLPTITRNSSHWIIRTFAKVKRRVVVQHPELKEFLFSTDKNKQITPHRYRCTFITELIKRTNGNVKLAQKAAGHARLQTTEDHYVDDESFDIRGAVASLTDKAMEDDEPTIKTVRSTESEQESHPLARNAAQI